LSISSWLVGAKPSHTSDHHLANDIPEALSVYIELQAARGEIQAKGDVVKDVITSTIDYRYQRYNPEGTPGDFGVPLELQSPAIVTLGNVGNIVAIMQ
jgi:hypothetical protein